jgi:hypothetical protein
MIISFAEILSQHTNDIEAPKALPTGQYEAAIDGLPEQEHLGPDKSPALVFKVKLLRSINANEDEVLVACNGRALSAIPMTLTMWLNGTGPYKLKVFLQDHLGIKEPGSLGEIVNHAPGCFFKVTVSHKKGRDGGVFAAITSTAAL